MKFCESLLFIFFFVIFASELLIMVCLLVILGWFAVAFKPSGLLRGFINNGFLFELSLRGLTFAEGEIGDLSSFFWW